MNKCVNLDWVQVHVREPFELNADYFRKKGYYVKEREYGTPLFAEMFTIYERDFPYIEIRRKPYSLRQNGGIFEPNDVHLRLSNRACYEWACIDKLRAFLIAHEYLFCNITRIDVCLDFNKFDNGENPQNFVNRYMKGDYIKYYQPKVSAHGQDHWDNRKWNSLKWGAEKSNITTKIYNKSMEMNQAKRKFYIEDCWKAAGLDITTDVWRVEFSLSSGAQYLVNRDGEFEEVKLSDFDTPERQLYKFHQLAERYFFSKQPSIRRTAA